MPSQPIHHKQFDPRLLNKDPFELRLTDSKNPASDKYGAIPFKYGDNKYITVDLGVIKSVARLDNKKDPKGNQGNQGGEKNDRGPSLLIPLAPRNPDKPDTDYVDLTNWANGVEERMCEFLEQERPALKMNRPEQMGIPMRAYFKKMINIKYDEKGMAMPDKPPVMFLKVKPWTKFFKPSGELMTPDQVEAAMNGTMIFNAIIRLTYLYCGSGKFSLQWNLDEATVFSVEPRGVVQTKTASIQQFIQDDPDAIEKLEKVLAEAKLEREKQREKLGHAVTGNFLATPMGPPPIIPGVTTGPEPAQQGQQAQQYQYQGQPGQPGQQAQQYQPQQYQQQTQQYQQYQPQANQPQAYQQYQSEPVAPTPPSLSSILGTGPLPQPYLTASNYAEQAAAAFIPGATPGTPQNFPQATQYAPGPVPYTASALPFAKN